MAGNMCLILQNRLKRIPEKNVQERRQSERVRQVFLPACMTIGDRNYVVVIRDLSESGIGIRCTIAAKPGQKVSVQWGSNDPLEGEVGWLSEDRMGVITECSPIAHSDGSPPRASRFEVSLPVKVYHRDTSVEGELVNLSTKGMSIAHPGQLGFGELVTVCLGTQSFEQCTIRWSRDGASGLLLKEALRLDEIRHILELAQGSWRWHEQTAFSQAS